MVSIKRSGKFYRCQVAAFSEHILCSPQNIVCAVVHIVKEVGKIVNSTQIGALIKHACHSCNTLSVGV